MGVESIEPYFDMLRKGGFSLDASRMQNVTINLSRVYDLAWGSLGCKEFGQALKQTAGEVMAFLVEMTPRNFVYIAETKGRFVK